MKKVAASTVDRVAPVAVYLILAAGGALAGSVGFSPTDNGLGTGLTLAWCVWVSRTLMKQGTMLTVIYRRLGIRGG